MPAENGPLSIVYRPLSGLIPYAKNARTHSETQIAEIAASVREFGWTNPILVDEEGGIIAGHGRVLAARQLGMAEVPTIELAGLTPGQRRLYVIADNKLALNAGWDEQMLAYELQDLRDSGYSLDLTGFGQEEVAALLAGAGGQGDEEVAELADDQVPELPSDPITKPGDVWKLGRHRIVCGDCRDIGTVQRLVADRKISVAFTSPPYASQRDYDASSGFTPIPAGEYVQWFEPVQRNVAQCLAEDGSWFVNIKPHSEGLDTSLYVLDLVIAHARQWGWHFASEFAWERIGVPGLPRRRFKNQFEPVYQFARADWKFRPQSVRHSSSNVMTYSKDNRLAGGLSKVAGTGGSDSSEKVEGLAYPGNLLSVGSNQQNAVGHPAVFPVSLPAFFLRAYSDQGDLIFDPFMGSGTTLIAAEQLGRVAVGTELSPGYCDVIVERWQNLTGSKAERTSP